MPTAVIPVIPATTASLTSNGTVVLFARAAELDRVQGAVAQLLLKPKRKDSTAKLRD